MFYHVHQDVCRGRTRIGPNTLGSTALRNPYLGDLQHHVRVEEGEPLQGIARRPRSPGVLPPVLVQLRALVEVAQVLVHPGGKFWSFVFKPCHASDGFRPRTTNSPLEYTVEDVVCACHTACGPSYTEECIQNFFRVILGLAVLFIERLFRNDSITWEVSRSKRISLKSYWSRRIFRHV